MDDVVKENTKEHNPNWPQIPDHPSRILIIEGSGSGKINSLFNLINQQPDIDKIYLYAKDPYETKYQFLINKRERTGLKHCNDCKAFIEYWNDMDFSDFYHTVLLCCTKKYYTKFCALFYYENSKQTKASINRI